MIALLLSVALLWTFLWLIARAVGQAGCFRSLAPVRPAPITRVSIIIPARNEEATIGQCLRALLAQSLPEENREIVAVDDGSTDRTAEIVSAFAREGVKLVTAPALPGGWTGKAHACWVGAQSADPKSKYLIFIDADVKAGPDLVTSAIGHAELCGVPFVSLAPRLVLGCMAERFVLPCGLYALAFLQDLKAIEAGADARATGQFILIDQALYLKIGGHAEVRGDICEDLELARLAFRAGARVEMRDGAQLADVRMYEGWRSLRAGLSKNALQTLGGARRALTLGFLAIVLSWAPFVLTLVSAEGCAGHDHASCTALAFSAAALAVALGFHIAGALRFGIPLWYGIVFPIGYSLCALISFDALIKARGNGVEWKGRTYPGGI